MEEVWRIKDQLAAVPRYLFDQMGHIRNGIILTRPDINDLGVFVFLNRQNKSGDTMPIASWNEPTKSLSLKGSEVIVLTRWTSPTEFLLLNDNNRNIKN